MSAASHSSITPQPLNRRQFVQGTAAYERRPVTWREIIRSAKRMKPQFEGLKA